MLIKKTFFFIVIELKLFIVKSATTDLEMERICSSAEFDKAEHKDGYRTIQHYADDDNIELTKAHPFYRSLFMEGKASNLNSFINSIALELVIEAIAVLAFFNYFLFICIWSRHSCLFKKFTDRQKLKKQKHCKYCTFIIMLVYFFISMGLSVLGIIFISSYKKALKLSDCGLLRFTNHGLYGEELSYAGALNLKDSFINSSYSLNQIETFYSKIFYYYSDIEYYNNTFNEKINDYNSYAVENQVLSPNPDKQKTDYIKMNYQHLYGPKTNYSTILGVIYQKYENKIKPIVLSLTNLNNYFGKLIDNKNAYLNELKKYGEYFDIMKMMYESINRNIGKVYSDYMKSGTNILYNLTIIFYVIFPILIIPIIVFIFIYICKKEATIFIKKYVRLIIHVLWNILFLFSSLGLVLSGYIGTYRKYSYNLIPSFNHLISSNTIMNVTSEDNLFIEFANSSEFSKSIELFNACYNSTHSTNIANILGIRDSLLYYFDQIYKEYNSLLFYVYNNSLNEDIYPFIEEQINIIDTYLDDIKKTTSFGTHRENDFSIYINELNRYTNFGDENTYQSNCVTKRNDIWVVNKDNCPNGYIYSLDGPISQAKYCLFIPDWIKDYYSLRYKSTCKPKINGVIAGILREKVEFYLDRIKEFYDQNKNLIVYMKIGAEMLMEIHDELIDIIYSEIENDNNTFLNFTLPYSMFTNDTNIYNLFECGILKNDLIDFYYYTRHKLSTNTLMHMLFLLMISLFNIAGIYILIKILYIFNRTTDEDEDKISEPEEIEIKNLKNKKTKNNFNIDDKDLLSINKKYKNPKENIKVINDKKAIDKISDKKGTKSQIYVGYAKNRDTETPSSYRKKLRETNGNSDNKSSENEESEENNNKNKIKDLDTSNDEEIESGIRDDGSAMS